MAQRTVIQLTDDLDGKAIKDGDGETVTFALDREEYEIDLSAKNAAALRDTLAKYVGAGRRVSGRSGGRGRGSRGARTGPDPREVREWAKGQGIEVSDRGRVPASLVVQFSDAQSK